MMPNINSAAARVLDRLGVSLVSAPSAGCCGAVNYHLDFQEAGLDNMRRNIDAWWPAIESGEVEALAMTASGCGVMVKEYGHLLAHDAGYAAKAARVSGMTRDLSELVIEEESLASALAAAAGRSGSKKIAYHPPCTLQHGQRLGGRIDALLRAAGCELTPVLDAQLCCGSAGSYSLLQPALSAQLGDARAAALQAGNPATVVTANVGCQLHLGARCSVPVRHWIELFDDALPARSL
jgi:glycolate oxidase iron-sulfur subunit